VQNKLLELRQDKPRIILQGTWLTVSFPKVLKTEQQYDNLLDLAFAVVDRLAELS
jgi:hypothetical protein